MTPSENTTGILEHKRQVGLLMQDVTNSLFERAVRHDDSKFSAEEFGAFEEATPVLKTVVYGTDEYRSALKSIKPAIDHHYASNRHHPEHFKNGVNDMTLIDVIEMVCDWIAAAKRGKDGDVMKSLSINKERFEISDQLLDIIKNTILYLIPIEG